MFNFFIDPVCHAKRAFRNSELIDKETFRKHQNIIGNTLFLSQNVFVNLEQTGLRRS